MWCIFNTTFSLNFTVSSIWNKHAYMRHLIFSELNDRKKRDRLFFYTSWNGILKIYLRLQLAPLPKTHSLEECSHLSHIYTSFCLSHLSTLKPLMNFPPSQTASYLVCHILLHSFPVTKAFSVSSQICPSSFPNNLESTFGLTGIES